MHQYLEVLGLIGVVTVILLFVKKISDLRTTRTRNQKTGEMLNINDNLEIEENSNLAFGLRKAGLFIGLCLAIAGSLAGKSQGFVTDALMISLDSVVIIASLFVIREVSDWLMLTGIDNDLEAKNKNVAVGVFEAGSYVATGLILNGAFSGEGESLVQGLLSALLFAGLGMVALLIMFWAYELKTPFSVRKEIKEGNVAAGTAAGLMLVAFGVILRGSIAGPFVGWVEDLKSFGISLAVGVVVLMVLRWVVDKIFLPNTTLKIEVERDKNVAAVVLAYGIVVGLAIVASFAI